MSLGRSGSYFKIDYRVYEKKDKLPTKKFFIVNSPEGKILGDIESEKLFPGFLQQLEGDVLRTFREKPLYQIGFLGGVPCILVVVGEDAEIPPGLRWYSWPSLLADCDPGIFQALARAGMLAVWNRNHHFCGYCGSVTSPDLREPALICSNCNHRSYPRLPPAVIVRITHQGEILLVRNKRSLPKVFSCVAGYVEPGESLEMAVQREVREEVNLGVSKIRYFGSQSWPFPHSLMVAFLAEAWGPPEPDGEEIIEAQWFTRENLPNLSRRGSIARKMIDLWVVE